MKKPMFYMSPSASVFTVEKMLSKWYLMGQSVDGKQVIPIMHSTNKKRLFSFIKKDLGLMRIEDF
jgi:hypothetical protein